MYDRNELPFADRADAGRRLADALARYRNEPDLLVLALPRGGVEVGYQVARALGAPLDVYVVRKLGVPEHEELAMGAIASGGGRVVNPLVIRSLRIPQEAIDDAIARETVELGRRERVYRGDRPAPEIGGRHVVLVDDGVATGATTRAAIAAIRQAGPRSLTLAVPVAPRDTARTLREDVDQLVCLARPEPFGAVGRWYRDFEQTTDEHVQSLLAAARRRHGALADAGRESDEPSHQAHG